MYLTYKYRLLTKKRDHQRLEHLLETQRQLYNAALEERIDSYRKTGKSPSLFEQQKSLTICRKEHPEMAVLPANLQRGTLRRVDRAFKLFYTKIKEGQRAGLPRFKGKGRYNTLEWAEMWGFSFRNQRIYSSAFGIIQVHLHRPLPSKKKPCNVRIVRNGKHWYVCFSVIVEPHDKMGTIDYPVGIDVGLINFATLSDGEKIPPLQIAKKAEKKLRIIHRKFNRCRKDSNNKNKIKAQLGKIFRKIRNTRRTHAHQISADLVKRFDFITIEDLEVKRMVQSTFGKAILDAGWVTLFELMRYKAERAGVSFIRVDPRNTSQECSRCGTLVPKPLSHREHSCFSCGAIEDRDVNAALNILYRGVVIARTQNVIKYDERAFRKLAEAY